MRYEVDTTQGEIILEAHSDGDAREKARRAGYSVLSCRPHYGDRPPTAFSGGGGLGGGGMSVGLDGDLAFGIGGGLTIDTEGDLGVQLAPGISMPLTDSDSGGGSDFDSGGSDSGGGDFGGDSGGGGDF